MTLLPRYVKVSTSFRIFASNVIGVSARCFVSKVIAFLFVYVKAYFWLQRLLLHCFSSLLLRVEQKKYVGYMKCSDHLAESLLSTVFCASLRCCNFHNPVNNRQKKDMILVFISNEYVSFPRCMISQYISSCEFRMTFSGILSGTPKYWRLYNVHQSTLSNAFLWSRIFA